SPGWRGNSVQNSRRLISNSLRNYVSRLTGRRKWMTKHGRRTTCRTRFVGSALARSAVTDAHFLDLCMGSCPHLLNGNTMIHVHPIFLVHGAVDNCCMSINLSLFGSLKLMLRHLARTKVVHSDKGKVIWLQAKVIPVFIIHAAMTPASARHIIRV